MAYFYGLALAHDGPVPNQGGMVVAGLGVIASLVAAVFLVLLAAGFFVAGLASDD